LHKEKYHGNINAIYQDAEVESKDQVQITVTPFTAPVFQIVSLTSLDADIRGFDANIAQAQAALDYWIGRQGELIALRERVVVEVNKVALATVVSEEIAPK
jgi:hypothetical protein